jgi:hypothetical protein
MRACFVVKAGLIDRGVLPQLPIMPATIVGGGGSGGATNGSHGMACLCESNLVHPQSKEAFPKKTNRESVSII